MKNRVEEEIEVEKISDSVCKNSENNVLVVVHIIVLSGELNESRHGAVKCQYIRNHC